jgi:hypothetical protein
VANGQTAQIYHRWIPAQQHGAAALPAKLGPKRMNIGDPTGTGNNDIIRDQQKKAEIKQKGKGRD